MFTKSDGHLHLLFGAVRKELLNDETAASSTKRDLNGDRIHPRKGHSCVCVGKYALRIRREDRGWQVSSPCDPTPAVFQ
jgi:hypothetical protein